ncbi:DUF421 domain-containing protein [Ammoniphilus sp. CFH 90114]|uniref:DUF421 domain-containing protein n=1 Tax=Ammoniphilus sp. CFH 90114 TaxID=2493665 RepID=UPI00100DDCB1|nr:DUF421 domain-containing protein [Ammoniphilus sp. CFH 90114]RXT09080.1 DUF421 domain-containing protein [Ammoniphilus sp. CFH 90114]
MAEWLIILFRSFLMFVIVISFLRIVGSKQTSQMTYADFVVGIAIGGIVALISLNVITNLAYGLLALALWMLMPVAVNYFAMKSKKFHDFIYGNQTILIKHGKVLEDNLKKVRYTGEELLGQLRRKNVFNLADVEFAVMEANGEVSVMLKPEQTPITPRHLEWKVAITGEPQTVILDGNIIDEGLRNQGLNRGWLHTELEKMGIALENVFIGQVDTSGDLYVDLFNDAIYLPKPTTKELLYATLKKCEADLELYALSTQDKAVKEGYQRSAEQLMEVLTDLRTQLKR